MSKSLWKDVEAPTRPQYDEARYDHMVSGLVQHYLEDALTNLRSRCLHSYQFDEALAYVRDTGAGGLPEQDAATLACEIGEEIHRQLTRRVLGGAR